MLSSDSLSSTIRLKLMTLWSLFERGGRIVVSSIMCSSVLRIRSSMFPLVSVLVRVGLDSSPGQLLGIIGLRVLPSQLFGD